MADQNVQQSPSSQSSTSEIMKGDDDAVQPQNQPISNTPPPQQLEQPENEEEPKEEKTFPCRYCNKTFATSTALGGHQNGHRRQRALDKKKAETPVYSYQPYPYPYPINYSRYPHCYTKPNINNFSGRMIINPMNNTSMESSTSSTNTWRLLAEFYANMRTKPQPASASAPHASATGTMFSGGVLRDFLGDSSARTTTASIGASGSAANVINLEDEEEEEEDAPELDLDLKL